MKSFAELNEREILALAIASEEDDNRVYMTFAWTLSTMRLMLFFDGRWPKRALPVDTFSFLSPAHASR